MRKFRWLNAEAIPPAYDLRRCGWLLCDAEAAEGALLLALWSGLGEEAWARPDSRAATLILGVCDGLDRAALLRAGFGDVLGRIPELDELDARAARVAAYARCEPRERRDGDLVADLRAREAFVAERRAGLHPREFDLLWRLMASPAEVVSRAQLLREIWRLEFEPETNSVAVHASRLRAKLKALGLPEVIGTGGGGYVYHPQRSDWMGLPSPAAAEPLDAHLRLLDDLASTDKVKP